ncbi:MAG: hypothetical protein VKP57_12480 [Candidatus Sericytochromatia bacterium]|nr:hypothetical protein [Candidatus Sericytochromatia bacterium]
MPQVRVAGRPVQDRHVVKLAEGRVEAARAQAQRNNVDDVFIKVGRDVWVASGSHIATDFRPGQEAEIDGRGGLFVHVDKQGMAPIIAGAVAGAALGGALGAVARVPGLGAWLGGFLGAGLNRALRAENPEFMRIHAAD